MNGQVEHVLEQLNKARLDRLLKWQSVAAQLNITPQHLLRIRRGLSPISEEVAAAIDKFLQKTPGTTWDEVSTAPAGQLPDAGQQQPPADRPPVDTSRLTSVSDSELATMTPMEIARIAVAHGRAYGPGARKNLLQRAMDVHRKMLDTLVSQAAKDNEHS